MVRPGSPELWKALSSSFDLEYSADLIYDDVRLVEGLPIVQPSFEWVSDNQVEGTGTVGVVWTPIDGTSVLPKAPGDWFAPFGARLVVFVSVKVGGAFVERVRLGEFVITDVPDAEDARIVLEGRTLTLGTRLNLKLADRMVEVQRDRYVRLEKPSQTFSAFRELAVQTGLQVTASMPDKTLTGSIVFEEDRFAVVEQIAQFIGGTPFMEWDGTVSVRPNTPGDPVAELTVGAEGTISTVGSSLSAAAVYNGVVIRAEGGEVLATRWLLEGPLRATPQGGARTPFHRVPRFYSNPNIKTRAQAEAVVDDLLRLYSTPRAAQLEVQCIVNPLLQVGDVVTVFDGVWDWRIRLTKAPLSRSAYMTVMGDVIDRVERR